MIIRATILVFALMFYMMVTAGGQATRAAVSPAVDEPARTSGPAAAHEERNTEAQTAANAGRVAPEGSPQRLAPDLIRISAYHRPEAATKGGRVPDGTGFFRLDEAALQGLTYSAAEKAISDEFTGHPVRKPQMTVRQALILGCGLMMREAQSMGVQSRGKFEKLDLHWPQVDSSLSVSAPQALARTY